MSNTNSDLLDDGLQAVIGKDRCQNEWQPPKRKAVTPAKKDEPLDEAYVKLNTVTPMAKVKCCAKWTILFGSISALLFYWQQAGLLDSRAAVPSLIFCALGAGLTIGYHVR